MNKIYLRIFITILITTSFYACKPATPILSTRTPTQKGASKTPPTVNIATATSPPTEIPTFTSSLEPTSNYMRWTTYNEPMGSRNASYTVQELVDLAQQSRLRGGQVTAGPIWIVLTGKKSVV